MLFYRVFATSAYHRVRMRNLAALALIVLLLLGMNPSSHGIAAGASGCGSVLTQIDNCPAPGARPPIKTIGESCFSCMLDVWHELPSPFLALSKIDLPIPARVVVHEAQFSSHWRPPRA